MINNDFFDDESNTKVYYWRDIFGDDDGDGNGANDFFDGESNTKVYYWRDIFGDDDGDGNGDG
jgi:hypothetical protein